MADARDQGALNVGAKSPETRVEVRDASGRFAPGHAGGPGRPRGRITKFREALARVSKDGDEIAEGLAKIWRDPSVPSKDRLAAFELALAYMLGKPEQSINIEADVVAGPRPALDIGRVLAALPDDVVDKVVGALDAAMAPRAIAAPVAEDAEFVEVKS